jgi:hypothetical protein
MRYSVGIMPMVKHFRDLDVYKGAMSLVMDIFAFSKQFPPDERFTLTDQIRRSSRFDLRQYRRGLAKKTL